MPGSHRRDVFLPALGVETLSQSLVRLVQLVDWTYL